MVEVVGTLEGLEAKYEHTEVVSAVLSRLASSLRASLSVGVWG